MTYMDDHEPADHEAALRFQPFFAPEGLPELTLADQIRHIVARLRGINEYDRQRLTDIAAAVGKREQMLEERRQLTVDRRRLPR